MKNRIMSFLFNHSTKATFIIIIGSIFICYYGIYALLGNKVIIKTKGMINLSTETSIINIMIGIICIGYIIYRND